MFKKFIAILFLLSALQPLAQSAELDKAELIRKFVQASGLESTLESFPAQIAAGAQQYAITSASPETDEKVAKVLADAFDVNQAKQTAIATLEKNASQQELGAIADWLDSPLGKRLTEAEKVANRPEFAAEMLRYAADLQATPPSSKRVALIQKFEKSTHATETTLKIFETAIRGIALQSNAMGKQKKKASEKRIAQEIKNLRSMMYPAVQAQSLLSSHYIYQQFSDEEIQQYIDYINSKVGKRYIELGILTMLNVFDDFFKDITNKAIQEQNKCDPASKETRI